MEQLLEKTEFILIRKPFLYHPPHQHTLVMSELRSGILFSSYLHLIIEKKLHRENVLSNIMSDTGVRKHLIQFTVVFHSQSNLSFHGNIQNILFIRVKFVEQDMNKGI